VSFRHGFPPGTCLYFALSFAQFFELPITLSYPLKEVAANSEAVASFVYGLLWPLLLIVWLESPVQNRQSKIPNPKSKIKHLPC
jgi:hypothetical protein